MVKGHHNMGSCVKGSQPQKAEDHCFKRTVTPRLLISYISFFPDIMLAFLNIKNLTKYFKSFTPKINFQDDIVESAS